MIHMIEYVYRVSMQRDKCYRPKVYWSDSLFYITTFVKRKLMMGCTITSDIEQVEKIYVMMFPAQEVKLFNDINGNQYILTKEMYVNTYNRATKVLNDAQYDVMERFLWEINKFIKDRDFADLIELMNGMVIEERYDDHIDKFTFGAREHHIQHYRIYPVEKRSDEISCQSGVQ